MILNAANVTLILSTIFNQGFVQNISVSNRVINRLNDVLKDPQQMMLLSQKVGIAQDLLKTFLNSSVNCAQLVKTGLPQVSFLTGFFFVDSLRYTCFGLQPLVPKGIGCYDQEISGNIVMVMLCVGFIFLLITSFTRHRKKSFLSCCHGYPGPVIPLNMLDSYENRKGFALSFGLTASHCLSVLLSKYDRVYEQEMTLWIAALPSYGSILVKILSAILISLVSYPFFVCQNMQNRVVGSILGIFFCVVWLSMEIARTVNSMDTCWKVWEALGYGEVFGIINTMVDYPLYICLVILLIKFIYTLIKTIIHRQQRKKEGEQLNWMFENDTDWKKEYMYLHVQNLFRRVEKKKEDIDEEEEEEEEKDEDLKKKINKLGKKFQSKFQSTLYVYKPEFKYSTRMMSSVFVTYIAMYLVTVFFALYGYLFLLAFNTFLLDNSVAFQISGFLNIKVADLKEWIVAITISWWLGLFTALIFSVAVMSNSVSWYRKHMMMLRKGDYTFLPRPLRKKKFDSASLMVASMKFAGFQVGYAAWGFLVLVVLLFLIYLLFITQIVFAIRKNHLTLLLNLLLDVWPTILIAIVVYIIQYVMAIKWFLFDKQTLQVDNRRVYHIVSYTMFYFNIFLGLVSCMIRIIFSIIVGTIFLQRLQKSTLPRAFELRDPGYTAYLGYILLEHQHSNPVIQCFTRLLMESVNKTMSQEIHNEHSNDFTLTSKGLMPCGFMDITDMSDVKKEVRRKKRIRTRWHLFILLSLNPTLLKYRFKNPKKNKRYSSDLLNRLNPRLTWGDDWYHEKNDDDNVDGSYKKSIVPFLSDHVMKDVAKGNQKVGVRYRRAGTVLEITYTVDEGDNKEVTSADKDYHLNNNHDSFEIELDNLTEVSGDNDNKNVKLLNYRKLSEKRLNNGYIIEVPEDKTENLDAVDSPMTHVQSSDCNNVQDSRDESGACLNDSVNINLTESDSETCDLYPLEIEDNISLLIDDNATDKQTRDISHVNVAFEEDIEASV